MDALLQTAIFGFAINLAAAAVSFYFWTENRTERYLLFWAISWGSGAVRWAIHLPAQHNPALLGIEGLLIPENMLFNFLGCYDLLPNKPWRQRTVVWSTIAIMLTYGGAANTVGKPLEMGYALFAATLVFDVICLGVAYRSERLTGYVFAAATFMYQFVVVAFLLFNMGRDVSNTIIVPLYNIPIVLCIAVIAHQRERRTLMAAEEAIRASSEEMRQLYTRLASVEDDERRALHGELHDQVGANLAALSLELDVAANLLTRDDNSNAQRHLMGAREVAAETIVVARNLMAELRPPALDDYGLVAALRTFAESQSARLTLPIQVTGKDLSPRPGRLVEGALFRIAQEAVINAAKHASASRVEIDVAARDGRVLITVADDGVGFDLDAPTTGPDHWGLKNMRERATAIGAEFRITTAPASGTRITAEAPREAE